MPKPFDATLNALIDAHLEDWARLLAARVGIPVGPATPLDTDLSSTLQADRLFRVEAPTPYAIHLELESSSRLGIPFELMRYNIAAQAATGLPIHSVVVLLRPKANASDQDGRLLVNGAGGRPYLTFEYTVIRVWEQSVSDWLSAGLGVIPLALLTDEAAADLPGAFEQLLDTLQSQSVPRKVAGELLSWTYWLGGLRYDKMRILDLFRSLNMILEDSSTYQWDKQRFLQEGTAKGSILEARGLIVRLGTKKFQSAPPAEVLAALEAITDRERLEEIADRVLDSASWGELIPVR
jgi:hypothetical protein